MADRQQYRLQRHDRQQLPQTALAISESGSGDDAATLLIAALKEIAESGSGDDALSIAAALSIAESGAGLSGLSLLSAAVVAIFEAATGGESIAVTGVYGGADQVIGEYVYEVINLQAVS